MPFVFFTTLEGQVLLYHIREKLVPGIGNLFISFLKNQTGFKSFLDKIATYLLDIQVLLFDILQFFLTLMRRLFHSLFSIKVVSFCVGSWGSMNMDLTPTF
jgi:hypothetical protein